MQTSKSFLFHQARQRSIGELNIQNSESNSVIVDNSIETTDDNFEKPVISSFKDLFSGLYESKIYKDSINTFFENKNLPADITEEEKIESLNMDSLGVDALHEYCRDYVEFKLDRDNLPVDVVSKINDYLNYVKYFNSKSSYLNSQQELEEMDYIRRGKHISTAKVLESKHLVPNVAMGREILKVILVSEGINQFEKHLNPFRRSQSIR